MGLILPGDAIAPNVLSGKKFSAGPNYNIPGSMTNIAADQAASAQSQSGTSILLTVPQGYWDGTKKVTQADANFLAANLINGMSLFGLTGNGTNAKRKASGSLTTSSNAFTVSGIAFRPSVVIHWNTSGLGTSQNYTMGVLIDAGFSWYNGSSIVTAYSIAVEGTNATSGTTGIVPVGTVTGITSNGFSSNALNGTFNVSWIAYE